VLRRSISALSLVLFACGGEVPARDAGPASQAPPIQTGLIGDPAPPEQPFTLTLHEPGGSPRREMRYRAVAGKRERTSIRQQTTNEISIAGRRLYKQEAPAVESTFDLMVDSVEPGRFVCSAWIVRSEAIDWARFGDEVGPSLRRSLEEIRGLKVHVTIDEHGAPLARELPSLDDFEIDRGIAMQTLKSMSGSVVAFPSEPIGIGARWTVVDRDGAPSNLAGPVSFDYTLTAVRGDRLELDVIGRLPTDPHPIEIGFDQVNTYSGSEMKGARKLVVDLTRILPVSYTGEHTSVVDGRLFRGGEELPFRAEVLDQVEMRVK
jgi:hypothetical protein